MEIDLCPETWSRDYNLVGSHGRFKKTIQMYESGPIVELELTEQPKGFIIYATPIQLVGYEK